MKFKKTFSVMALILSTALLSTGCGEDEPETIWTIKFEGVVKRDGKPVRGYASFYLSFEADGRYQDMFPEGELSVGGMLRTDESVFGTNTDNIVSEEFKESMQVSVAVGDQEAECQISPETGIDWVRGVNGKDKPVLRVKVRCDLEHSADTDHSDELEAIFLSETLKYANRNLNPFADTGSATDSHAKSLPSTPVSGGTQRVEAGSAGL